MWNFENFMKDIADATLAYRVRAAQEEVYTGRKDNNILSSSQASIWYLSHWRRQG